MAINAPTNLLTICQRKKNVIKGNGSSEAGKVDCIKVCESFMLPPITYGVTNPEEHYITCEKRTTGATL